MNEPMDFGAMMQGYILSAAIRTAGMMMLELMFTIVPREREEFLKCQTHYQGIGIYELGYGSARQEATA